MTTFDLLAGLPDTEVVRTGVTRSQWEAAYMKKTAVDKVSDFATLAYDAVSQSPCPRRLALPHSVCGCPV